MSINNKPQERDNKQTNTDNKSPKQPQQGSGPSKDRQHGSAHEQNKK